MTRRSANPLSELPLLGVALVAITVAWWPAVASAQSAGTWTQDGPVMPPGRFGGNVAADPSTGRVIEFGGFHGADELNDTWSWSGAGWTRLDLPASPPPRYWAAMADDPANGTVVLFGGGQGHFSSDDTWTWDGHTWTEQHPAVSPPARTYASMAYDPANRSVLLFGGYEDSLNGAGDDTWEWNGTTWTQMHPATSPPADYFVSLSTGPNNTVVLFSGAAHAQDTWVWDGSDWTQVSPATQPPGRAQGQMAYDPSTGTTYLFGGFNNAATVGAGLSDFWTWDGSTWTPVQTMAPPEGRFGGGLAYDSVGRSLVLTGGATGYQANSVSDVSEAVDTWTWNGAWTQYTITGQPPGGDFIAAAAAPNGTAVMFGGTGDDTDTWVWSADAWTKAAPGASPSARSSAMAAYDSDASLTYLFGGISALEVATSDMWSWDGSSWHPVLPATSPPARAGGAMVYDPLRKQLVLFGGITTDAQSVLGDTWTFSGGTWTQQHPATSPSARYSAGIAFDSVHGVIVLFGGRDASGANLNDTWTWDGTGWTEQHPQATPDTRYGPAMAWDATSQSVLLYGGSGSGFLGDTWTWDGGNWTQQTPPLSPLGRLAPGAAPLPDGVLIYSGFESDGELPQETWIWGVPNAAAVPESPVVPLLPLLALVPILVIRLRRRR